MALTRSKVEKEDGKLVDGFPKPTKVWSITLTTLRIRTQPENDMLVL